MKEPTKASSAYQKALEIDPNSEARTSSYLISKARNNTMKSHDNTIYNGLVLGNLILVQICDRLKRSKSKKRLSVVYVSVQFNDLEPLNGTQTKILISHTYNKQPRKLLVNNKLRIKYIANCCCVTCI